MNYSNTIFNQLLNFLPRHQFNQFVGQHNGDRYVKKLKAWNQLVLLLYAQATGKDSLREIETGFSLHNESWYHLGVNTAARSSLSYANNNRSYEIFEKLFYSLLEQSKKITPNRTFAFANPLYSFDSTTVQLCLNIFNWAKFRTTKGALKLHALLNNRTTIPEVVIVTEGNISDIKAIKSVNLETLEKESILVFDRAYIDYDWWKKLDQNHIYFVSRTKISQNIFVIGQHNPNELKEKSILADELVIFGAYREKYQKTLRRIRYYNENDGKEYIYLTNNFDLAAGQIAFIYKDRWQIELFFKWIKQNLKIKTFLGTSKNAVLTQIWVAMIYYLLLAYIKFQTKFSHSLLELTRMIAETLLCRRNLIDLLSLCIKNINKIKLIEEPQLTFW